jgi:hypothetical protein
MSTVALFPWIRLAEPYEARGVRLIPYRPGLPLPSDVETSIELETLNRIVASFLVTVALPVEEVVLVLRRDQKLGDDCPPEAQEELFQFAKHLAASSLSERTFGGREQDFYAATGHFELYIRSFTPPFTGHQWVSLRQKGAVQNIALSPEHAVTVMPLHLVDVRQVFFNAELLDALEEVSAAELPVQHRIRSSVDQYLAANTDSTDVPFMLEALATYAALERVVDAKESLEAFRGKVSKSIDRVRGMNQASDFLGAAGRYLTTDEDALRGFLKEFYLFRGAVAHGRRKSFRRSWDEFMVAGAILYPLLLKLVLNELELYDLIPADLALILGYEYLISRPPPTSDVTESIINWKHRLAQIELVMLSADLKRNTDVNEMLRHMTGF